MTALAAALALAACDYPYDARANALGPDTEEPGPRHRPGQPCLACHGTQYTPGGVVFDVAGTIYDHADDAVGLNAANVIITDANGLEVEVTTNIAGNFAVIGSADVTVPVQQLEGIWAVPGPLVFPLKVSIDDDGMDKNMRSVIHRDGSCASCHTAPANATSAGKIFVRP